MAVPAAALVAVLVVAGARAQAPPAPLASLVSQIEALFPPVSGEVIEVQDSQLILTLSRRDGIGPGVEVSVFREGRELRHPRTGQVLGRMEEPVGRAALTDVREAYSVATHPDASQVRPGDRVRVSAGKIRLALLSLDAGVRDRQIEAVVQELLEELGRTGRFQAMRGDALGVRLSERGIDPGVVIDGKGLDSAAKSLGVDYVLAILFKRVDRKPYMEVRLFSDRSQAPLLRTALFVPSSVKPVAPAQGQFSADARGGRPGQPQRTPSLLARLLRGDLDPGLYSRAEGTLPLREVARFPFAVLAMDIATAPADRAPRVVVSDGERVYQYRIAGLRLEAEWTFNTRGIGRVFSVQFADLDGDGRFEVVANRWDPRAGLTSFILTVKQWKPEYLASTLGSILLAVDTQGQGVKQTLWAQKPSEETFWTLGQADEVVVEDGRLEVVRSVLVPSEFRATGAVFSNIAGSDRRALVFVDEHNRLRVSADGQDLWRSSSAVGGGYLRVEVFRLLDRAGQSRLFKVEPTPLAFDLDGDGVQEVVVPQNVVKEGLLAVVYKSPAGFRLQTLDTGFEGGITALGAFKEEDAEQPTLVASVVNFTNLFRTVGETRIIMTVPLE